MNSLPTVLDKYRCLYFVSSSFFIASCVPQAFVNTDFKSHLTPQEVRKVKEGDTVEKIHVSYWRFKPSQIYWTGPLRVRKNDQGKTEYTPHGTWVRYFRNGAVEDSARYSEDGKISYTSTYHESHQLYVDFYDTLTTVNEKEFNRAYGVEFRNGNRFDTLSIKRWGAFDNKSKTTQWEKMREYEQMIEFDAQGKRRPMIRAK